MRPVPFIRRIAFQHCTSTLEMLGFEPDRVLNRAGIPHWQHGKPMELVPVHDLLRVFDVGAKTIGDPSFGSIVGANNPMQFGRFSGMIGQSVSLYDAFQNCARFVNYLNSSSQIWVSNLPTVTMLCRSRPPGWQMEQYVLQHMVGVVQMAYGSCWRPSDVYLTAQKTNGLEDTELFADTTFHLAFPYLALAIPKVMLGTELRCGQEIADSNTEAFFEKTSAAHDFTGSICQIIENMLPHDSPDIKSVSEIVGVSKRTLQRELAKEGEVFRALVGKVRFKNARNLLVNTDMPQREIAHYLGYSSESHFVRAFLGWAGVTPGMHRVNHRLH